MRLVTSSWSENVRLQTLIINLWFLNPKYPNFDDILQLRAEKKAVDISILIHWKVESSIFSFCGYLWTFELNILQNSLEHFLPNIFGTMFRWNTV